MLHDLPDPKWIVQAQLEPALQAIVDAGLALDALVRPVHLPALLQLCRSHLGPRVLERAASYGGWWDETQVLLQACDANQRAAILRGTARRVYRH